MNHIYTRAARITAEHGTAIDHTTLLGLNLYAEIAIERTNFGTEEDFKREYATLVDRKLVLGREAVHTVMLDDNKYREVSVAVYNEAAGAMPDHESFLPGQARKSIGGVTVKHVWLSQNPDAATHYANRIAVSFYASILSTGEVFADHIHIVAHNGLTPDDFARDDREFMDRLGFTGLYQNPSLHAITREEPSITVRHKYNESRVLDADQVTQLGGFLEETFASPSLPRF